MTRDTLMEFTGSNGGFSILLPRPEVNTFPLDSFPLGEVEELYCESSSAPDMTIDTDKTNRIVARIVPVMSQLRKITFAMCTNSIIQAVLSSLNRAIHLKSITLAHCDQPDPTYGIFCALHFAMGRTYIDAKLEEIRVIYGAKLQWNESLYPGLSGAVNSFALIHQSPSETRRTNIEIQRGFPASIQKTYPLFEPSSRPQRARYYP